MASKDPHEKTVQIMQETMRDFRASMEHTLELSTRIGRRTTTIIRMGMLSVFILAACMLYLIGTLAGDFSRITTNMVLISENTRP